MTIAALTVLLTTGAFAQRYGTPAPTYPSQPGYNQPGYNQPGYGQPGYGQGQPSYNYDYDDHQFDRHLDWWDRELNLSRRQERSIRRIREGFKQQALAYNPRDPRQRESLRQLRQREFFDMMAVLNPAQRNRVIDRMRPYEGIAGRSNGRNYGRGSGYGQNRY